MAKDHLVSFRLPGDLLTALMRAARTIGCPPADIARSALAGTLAGPATPRDIGVRDAARAATGWTDLQSRLRALGFMLRADGARVILHSWPRDRPLIRAEAAGIDAAELTLRFGAPFPGFAGQAIAGDSGRSRQTMRRGALKQVA